MKPVSSECGPPPTSSSDSASAQEKSHHIDKETINALPLIRYEGAVHVVHKTSQLAEAVRHLQNETVIGFDTESRPSFRPGVVYPTALLQFASESAVYLIQILALGELEALLPILTNPQILKVGVAIHDDLRKLRQRLEFEPAGFVEISSITQRAGLVNTGLRSLSAYYLGARISKGAQVTNWSRSQLTAHQIQYAATDAWIALRIYRRLVDLGLVRKGAEATETQACRLTNPRQQGSPA